MKKRFLFSFFLLLAISEMLHAQGSTTEIAYYKVLNQDTALVLFRLNRFGITLEEGKLRADSEFTPDWRILIETDGRGGFYRIDPKKKKYRRLTTKDYPRPEKWMLPENIRQQNSDTLVFTSALYCCRLVRNAKADKKPASFDRLAEFIWPGLRNAVEQYKGAEEAGLLPGSIGYAPVKNCVNQKQYVFLYQKQTEASVLNFVLQGDWEEDLSGSGSEPAEWPPQIRDIDR